MQFPAHIRIVEDGEDCVQTVTEHNRNAGAIAARCLAPVGMQAAGKLAGLLHDAGKNTDDSRAYQQAVSHGENARRGSVIHTFQGCRMLLEAHHAVPETYTDVTRELLAYAVGAHHGLFDCLEAEATDVGTREHGFQHRMHAQQIGYAQSRAATVRDCGGEDALLAMFAAADEALRPVYDRLETMTDPQTRSDADGEFMFYLGLLARLLLSAVMEGDRRDTAAFMTGIPFPEPPEDMRAIWSQRLRHMEKRLEQFAQDTPIRRARSTISGQCRQMAEKDSGVYRLNVPTGAGKTLSALRFSLAHAAKHGKRRILFVSPLLTILEQNAAVWRQYIGADDMVLEHHSNVFHAQESAEALDRRELLEAAWDAPVILTTLVQLLNTLFSGKTTSVRRFWALCDSVVVIDEVQTVPAKMLTLFNLAVNYLSAVCKTTFVLCSATQPCLEHADHPLLCVPQEMVPYDPALWRVFRRTRILPQAERRLEEIPDFCREVLSATDSLLVVCNKRAEAEYVFRSLSESYACWHLSASMCPAHRRATLTRLSAALRQSDGQKVVCVATQVIEAGVDISFGSVIRLSAGLDNIIQSAGRCNRNGEALALANVYVVPCAGERLGRLPEIAEAKQATASLLDAYRRDGARFSHDISSDAAVSFYYRRLYTNMRSQQQDFRPADKPFTLYDLLSGNLYAQSRGAADEKHYCLRQAFRTAGRYFQVFDDDTLSAVAPYGEGVALIEELAAAGQHMTFAVLQNWLERAKPYMVSIYHNQVRQLEEGGMYALADVRILSPAQYDPAVGLVMQAKANEFLEV